MIAETIPQIGELDLESKFQLAVELWDDVLQHESEIADPPGLRELLEQRLANYEAGKTTGRPWQDVKRDLLARRKS